jgi:hypothetical protein
LCTEALLATDRPEQASSTTQFRITYSEIYVIAAQTVRGLPASIAIELEAYHILHVKPYMCRSADRDGHRSTRQRMHYTIN